MIHNPPLSPQPSVLSPQSSSFPALDALLLIVILNLVLQPLVEPDFGWHLRTGLDLLQQGWQLPVTDPYSHTMPEWPWVEHAWLTDGVLGLIYQGLGPAGALGVIIFFGAIAAGAFLIPSVTARTSRTYKLIAVALALWVTLPFLGARTQLITLLGIAVVLWLAKRARAGWITGLWAMPPLFLIWANVHGGFMAGLFVLGLLLAGSVAMRLVLTRWPSIAHRLHEPIMTWSEIRLLAIVTAVSALVTLANPYGWRLHAEIYDSLTNQFMIETLHEWQPVSLRNWAGRAYALYLAGLILVMLCCYRRVEPVRWTICLVFLGLSLRHWRNVLFFVLVSLPLCTELLKVLVDRVIASVPIMAVQPKRWLLALTVALALWMGWLGSDHVERVVWAGLAPIEFYTQTDYPIEAVQWVRAHREQVGKRLLNDYGHGGFLLWWLPGEKVFIDGRMPAWRIGDRWIFYDYVALTSWDPPALGVLDKYGVDWALVGLDRPITVELARHSQWRPVYEDRKVRIFVRH